MELDLAINNSLIIPGAELHVTTSRASGPGGQHVNKTSSRVSLRWNIMQSAALSDQQRARLVVRLKSRLVGDGEILIHVESERSQHRNRQIAREKLAQLIQDALHVEKRRIATKPTASAKNKRLEGKIRRSTIKKLRRIIDE